MSRSLLEIEAFTAGYAGRPVIRSARFSLPFGEVAGLVGPNGAGKSTLLAAMAGQLPHHGSLRCDGAAIDRRTIAYLPQSHGVHAGLTVLEVVLLGRRERLGWRVSAVDLETAAEALQRLSAGDLAGRAMDSLSGGQQQLVLLAQRLVSAPEILLLDEPTSALDLHHQLTVMSLLRAYAARAKAVVLAAIHDLALAGSQCDRILLLHGGGIAAAGPPQAVLTATRIGAVYRVTTNTFRSEDGRSIHVPVAAIPKISKGDLK